MLQIRTKRLFLGPRIKYCVFFVIKKNKNLKLFKSKARLMAVICEQASVRSKSDLVSQLMIVFEEEEFFKKVVEHFSESVSTSAHINPKLHLIG